MKIAESAPQDAVQPDGSTLRAWVLTLRTISSSNAQRMLRDALHARAMLSPRSQLVPAALVIAGFATMQVGRLADADDLLVDAAELGEGIGGPGSVASALALRSMIALRRQQLGEAETLIETASQVVHSARLEDYPVAAMVHAVRARLASLMGDTTLAVESIAAAEELLPVLTRALIARSVEVRLELASTHLALGDVTSADQRLHELRELLLRTEHFDQAEADVERLSVMIETVRATVPDGAHLTPAELRLLPFLATQLSFREIAEQLFLSVHTVKAQVTAIYRKLGVSSRTQAVERARSIGLLPTEA